jgi:anhydro-N-acetylmuramic acid kinase
MATLVELTALSLVKGIQYLESNIDEFFVCGGGAHNNYLMERLSHHLKPGKVKSTISLGIHPDWVEAMAFAWLARQTIKQLPGNLPSVTSAKTPTILGGVYFSHRQA